MVNCQTGLCVVLSKCLLAGVEQGRGLTVQKAIVEGQYCDIVATSDKNLPKPAFPKLKDAGREISTQ